MNTTVSGTDDPRQHHVSQIATSSSPVTRSNQRITYTTAQLHENNSFTPIQIAGRQVACKAAYNIELSEG